MVLHFRKATSIFRKTMPFVLLRMGVGILLGLVTVLYFGVILWFGLSLLDSGTLSGPIAGVGLLVAVVLFVGAWRLAARYILYMVKAGHIAVIAHIVETGEVPPNQFQYGKERVTEHFTEASALFAVDALIKGVIKQFNDGALSFAKSFAVVPALRQLIQIVGKAVAIAASYIDEAIIAYMFTNPDKNAWTAARDGVVLYGKNWRPVLGSTMLIVLGMYAAGLGVLLALTPLANVLGNLSPALEVTGWAVVGGLFLTIYVGFLKPWVKTVVITTFLIEAGETSPDSATMDRIADRSEKFTELMSKADEETPDDRSEQPDRTPVTGAKAQ
ncbi:hypothetical protein EA462_16890 [Natrarchaeobius halalkaliphilus]|uniref:Uncharacterized protein n=1 Tax=Natrarchaeobius halalkaliphilus TaxID=1679091 RepID=A0A3N6LXY8_9EURY|nr:hypothetical protein [Natrarchaeobius halalkaliphilus]RQG86148.1 hypothetical protein EA462_16890 [Natrarchaeobius halalkaliphilus]